MKIERQENQIVPRGELATLETRRAILLQCASLCEDFRGHVIAGGVATEISGTSGDIVIDVEKVVSESSYSYFKFPGKNGYVINLAPIGIRNFYTKKIYPEVELSSMRYFIDKNGFLMSTMNSNFHVNTRRKHRVSIDTIYPINPTKEQKKKFPIAVAVLKKRVGHFLSMGEIFETNSPKDHFWAGEILKKNIPPAVIPYEDHARALLTVLRNTKVEIGENRPVFKRELENSHPDF